MIEEQEFNSWWARYKAWRLEVFESDRHQNWLVLNEVRQAVPSLRKDAVLLKSYLTGLKQLDKSKRLFIDEQALAAELKRNNGQDALMFLAWFERTVVYPARRKRETLPALPTPASSSGLAVRGGWYNEENAEVGLAKSVRKPVHAPEVFRETSKTDPQSDARGSGLFGIWSQPLIQIWRGEVDLKKTFFVGGL